MAEFVSEAGDAIELAPGQKIIALNEYLKLERAENIVDVAIKKADDMTERAQQAYQLQEELGYEEGVEIAKAEMAKKMIANSQHAIDYLAHLEKQVVDVVLAAVRKIIGDYDDAERARLVVGNMLSAVKAQQNLTLRVAPNACELSNSLVIDDAAERAQLSIIVDEELPGDSFILETPMGVMDGSLEAQIDNIRAALAKSFD